MCRPTTSYLGDIIAGGRGRGGYKVCICAWEYEKNVKGNGILKAAGNVWGKTSDTHLKSRIPRSDMPA